MMKDIGETTHLNTLLLIEIIPMLSLDEACATMMKETKFNSYQSCFSQSNRMLQYLSGTELSSEVLAFEKLFLFEDEFEQWFSTNHNLDEG
jgi:hypothetical protein